MRRRSGNWRSARKIPDPPPTARVPRGRPWSSMLQNSSRQPCGLNRHSGLPSTLQRTSRLTEARPALPPKAGHARGDLDTPFGATRRHRIPPRAGEVHVASSRSRKPLSVHLGECGLVLVEKRRETSASSISASRRRRRRIAGTAATRMGARLSDAAGAPRRPLSRRNCARHRRARGWSTTIAAAQAAIHRRQPAGRRQQCRHGGCRPRSARRLYAPGRDHNQRHQRLPPRQPRFRSHPRHCAGGGARPLGPRDRGQSVGPGANASRVHRLREGQSRHDQLRVSGQRRRHQRGRRAVQRDGRRQPVNVPYRGNYLPDLLSGQVQASFTPILQTLGYIKAGKLRALAVTGATRSESLPDVPAAMEFVPGYQAYVWDAVGAPAKTPVEIVEQLNKEINAVLLDPAIKAQFASLGAEPMLMTPAEFGTYIASEIEKWGKVVKTARIKVD